MAAVWEGEGDECALSAVSEEWDSEECFGDVSGLSVVLCCAKDVIQVAAIPKPATEYTFKALFDNKRLDDAGFGPRMDFEKRVKLVAAALRGAESLSATLKADSGGMKLTVRVPMAGFYVDYTLPLKRVRLDHTSILKAKLQTTDQQLTESRALVAEMQQMLKQTKAALREANSDGDAAKQQLAEARSELETCDERAQESERRSGELKAATAFDSGAIIEELREAKAKAMADCRSLKLQLATAKAHAAADHSAADDLRAEIRIRDARIRELQKRFTAAVTMTRTPFAFDTRTNGGMTNPKMWQVSAKGKAAKAKKLYAQIVLQPTVGSDSQLSLVLETVTGTVIVGVTDDYSKWVSDGCRFDCKGVVTVNGSHVAESQAFGGWQSGDRLFVTANVSSGTVCIRAPNGHFCAKWKPRSTPIWFALKCFDAIGTKVRID